MKAVFKNILIVIAGFIIGSAVNMGLIIVGGEIFPLAEGMEPLNATGWDFKYFIFPFLAHAVGTLAGAFFVAKFASSHNMLLALLIGLLFLAGGIYMVFILPAPLWFIVVDLGLAYIPMGWFGWKLAVRSSE